MPPIRYENAHLVIGETNPHVRHSLKTALFSLGVRDITDCTGMEMVVELLDDISVDLLICDVDLPGGDLCDVVHALRDHSVGRNPFMVTIATTADAEMGAVRRILEAGVDDLVVKPLSIERVIERINKQVTGRKPFVVTHQYIGPDRRMGMRSDDKNPIQPIEVPNTLRSKIMGVTNLEELQRLVDDAVADLNDRKMERYSVEIVFLSHRIRVGIEGDGSREQARRDMERLLFVANDLSRRLRGTHFAHAADLAASLVTVCDRAMRMDGLPSSRDMELLSNLALAIQKAFSADFGTVEAAMEISSTIARFHRTR